MKKQLIDFFYKNILIFKGNSQNAADNLIANKSIYDDLDNDYIKKYLYLEDLSGKYTSLISNRLAMAYEFPELEKHNIECMFQIIKRNGMSNRISLVKKYEDNTDIIKVLSNEKKLLIIPSDTCCCDYIGSIAMQNNELILNDKKCDESGIRKYVNELADATLIVKTPVLNPRIKYVFGGKYAKLTLLINNENWMRPQFLMTYMSCMVNDLNTSTIVFDDYDIRYVDSTGCLYNGFQIPQWNLACSIAKKIAYKLKDIELLGVELIIGTNNVKIWKVSALPPIPKSSNHCEEFYNYVRKKAIQKKAAIKLKKKFFLLFKFLYSTIAEHYGYMGFMMKNWHRDLINDFLSSNTSIKDKIWANRRGFLSYRIKQYNLSESNIKCFLSDRDYRKLRPINNEFVVWVYDKVVLRYVLEKKKEYLPQYYFHLIYRHNEKRLIPLHDCPENIECTSEGIVDLLKQKKELVLKPSEGSHGNGFYKLECVDNEYYLNNNKIDELDLLKMLNSIKRDYAITEYVQMNESLKELYDKATYTIRIMSINEKGNNPWLADAYVRIATQKTGLTDNIADGGICARIDMESGEIYDPEQIIEHEIHSCRTHPDTGKDIKGCIPNWSHVKQGVLDICKFLFQLEYLGFDVVVTETGFKILEINTHQDLHRYPHYDSKIHEFFMNKLDNNS